MRLFLNAINCANAWLGSVHFGKFELNPNNITAFWFLSFV